MEILFIIIALIFSIIIHEISHGYAADKLGDPTARYSGRLTLNPSAHLDPIGSILVPFLTFFAGGFIFGWAKPVPYNPNNLRNPKRDSILVGLAGPLSNIILAISLAVIYKFSLLFFPFISAKFFITIIRLNLILAIFNLLPIPPLDGSKIFLSSLPIETQMIFETYGIFILVLFLFFLSGIVISTTDFLMNLIL